MLRRTVVLLASSFLVSAAPVAAQQTSSSTTTGVPRVVRVTGTFRPITGVPAPVEIVTFAIYADETGGSPLWQETQNVLIASNGHYDVLLGAATRPDGLPRELFASGDAHWLAVHVERPGEPDPPRVPLTSVPYALRASDADTLGGKPASAYLLAPVGDTTSPGTKTKAATRASASANPAGIIDTGTVNQVAKYVNASDVGPSAISESGGLVGVNTTTPHDAMHVQFTNTNGSMTGYAVQNLGTTATSYSGMLFYDQNGALGQFQGFNNSTHEYRINNIASGGSINFMLGSSSKFQVRSDGDIDISGNIRKGGVPFLHNFGLYDTFLGMDAGNFTMTGIYNTATGTLALSSNTTGSDNTASGVYALRNNTTGSENTATGLDALFFNTTGWWNTSTGSNALNLNTTGNSNTAIGAWALGNNKADGNVALGYQAGLNATTGSNNIYLGANVFGVAGESSTMYLGRVGTQTRTFIAGVRSITTGAADAVTVMIDSQGQLGTVNSSRRYKEDIQDMGDASSGLMKLRPVTFRYAQPYADGRQPIDYGLIAEEVEAVYPDLVVHLADGQVETVQYQKINAMLLNEVQKQHRALEEQRVHMEAQHAEIERLKARLERLEARSPR
jgi:hypothetical protein